MKKISLAVAAIMFSGTAIAGGINYHPNNASAKAYGGNANAQAYGTGIGIGGQGGSAYAGVKNKNLNSSFNANLNSNRNYNRNYNRNNQGQMQGQLQGQRQGQMQGNVGLGSGNQTNVDASQDNDYDVPAIAPSVSPSPATAPCYATWSVNAAVPMFGAGGAGFVKDHGCAFGEVARRAASIGNLVIAEEALAHMYRIVKDEAGVSEKEAENASGATTVSADTDSYTFPTGN